MGPVLSSGFVAYESLCTNHTARLASGAYIHVSVHAVIAGAHAFGFKVGAIDCFRKNESDRESMLQLFCRVFITLRGSALIMHEYTVPPTSQHFTGGRGRRSQTAK